MLQIASAKNLQEQQKLESSLGTRFSVNAFLSNYDTIRMTVIHRMHNLFLGKQNIFWNSGKIPTKISPYFDGFDADEYKNWVLLFSTYVLDDLIPKRDKECFRKFASVCQYICKRINMTIAHGLLIQFWKDFEILYGKEKVIPNMHLLLHLKDSLLDFGPIYSFCLFFFGR